MRVSVFLDYAADVRSTIEAAVEAERAGADVVWVAEAYGFDAVSILAAIAERTDRIGIASGVLQLGTRTPALLAMTAVGLDAVSGGRFLLGLGTSGPQVVEGFHGMSFDRPLTRTRETIEVCRKVWRREPLVYDGDTISVPRSGPALRLMATPLRERVPIYLAAMGPRNVALAAEVAEGWLPMFGFFDPNRWHEVWGEPLTRGSARRDPSLPPLDVVAGAHVAIGDGVRDAASAARQMAALYIGGMGSPEQNFYNQLLRRYGYESEAQEIQDLYLGRRREEAAAAVPDEFLAATSLYGDRAFVSAQLERYRDAGVTTLLVRPAGSNRAETIRTLCGLVREIAPDVAR